MTTNNFEMNRKSDDIYSIKVLGVIGDQFDDWFFDGHTSDTSFKDTLAQIPDDVTTLEIGINSPGGSVTQGVSIYNMLRESGYKIRTYILGEASSIASVIFMAGDERIFPDGTFALIHTPSHSVNQNLREAKINLAHLESVNASMKSIYLTHLNVSEDELDEMLDKETIITPSEGIEIGFATSKTLPNGVEASQSIETVALRAETTKQFLQDQNIKCFAKLENFNNEVDMTDKTKETTIDVEALIKEKGLLEGKLEAAEKMKAQVETDFSAFKDSHQEVDVDKIRAEAKAEAVEELKAFEGVKAKAVKAGFKAEGDTSEAIMRDAVNEFGMKAESFKDVDAITEMFNYVIANKPNADTEDDYAAFVDKKDDDLVEDDSKGNFWDTLNKKSKGGK